MFTIHLARLPTFVFESHGENDDRGSETGCQSGRHTPTLHVADFPSVGVSQGPKGMHVPVVVSPRQQDHRVVTVLVSVARAVHLERVAAESKCHFLMENM